MLTKTIEEEEEERLNQLDHDSEEFHMGWAKLRHTPTEGRPVRMLDAVEDPIYLKNNIASILEYEEILLGPPPSKYQWRTGQLLIRFPNDLGLSILYYSVEYDTGLGSKVYSPAKIIWDKERWEIDKEFACKYISNWSNLILLPELTWMIAEIMEEGREGLWGLSAKEYDVIWKMRLGF